VLGFAAKLLAVIGERRRTREATAALAVLNDRMLAEIGLRREDVPFAARGGLGRRWVRMDGLTLATPPARAEGEGNGDPFALHVPGQVVSVGRAPQAQAGMDAGPQIFRPLPATREVRAAPAPQTAVARFALQTRP
jgi:uncharacterized protein YjiS (DUF1127 family)